MATIPATESEFSLPNISEWRAALLAAIEIAEETLSRDTMATDVAQDLEADAEEMTEERDWIAESRARLDKLRSLLINPSTSDVLPRC